MSSNIPSAPAYGVYAAQLIRYARCCSNYSDFLSLHRALVTRLLSQGNKVNRLFNTSEKFCGRHTDLVGQYKKNVCQMFADSISWNEERRHSRWYAHAEPITFELNMWDRGWDFEGGRFGGNFERVRSWREEIKLGLQFTERRKGNSSGSLCLSWNVLSTVLTK